MLIKGRWRNLVLDIEEFQKENLPNNNYASNVELREHLQEYFKSRGYVKTNINRSVTQKRKWLQAELQLLNKLGLRKLDEEKSKKVGFVFDFNKINKFSEAYYKEYKDDER